MANPILKWIDFDFFTEAEQKQQPNKHILERLTYDGLYSSGEYRDNATSAEYGDNMSPESNEERSVSEGGATGATAAQPKQEQLIDLDSPDHVQPGPSHSAMKPGPSQTSVQPGPSQTTVIIETAPYNSGASAYEAAACEVGPGPSSSYIASHSSAIPNQDQTRSAKISDFDSLQTEVKWPLGSDAPFPRPPGSEDPCRSSDHLLDKPFPRPRSWMTIHNAAYYMRYALGCYGWPVYLYMHPCVGCCKLWIDCRSV